MDQTFAVHFLEESEHVEQIDRRQLRDTSNVLSMPTSQFIADFRISKDIFVIILNVMQQKCSPGFRTTQIRPDIKLATFMRFLATGSYQRNIGNESVSSTSKSSVYRIIKECLQLFEEFICPQYIQMPLAEEESTIMEEFFKQSSFPGIIGCVDGTHIRIKSPGDNVKHLYYNKREYYSINAMMICDHKMNIRYVDARHPGDNDDAFIWEYSMVDQKLQNAFDNGKRNAWILGDGGYKLKPFLMTPYKIPKSDNETRYNKKHASAHNVIERCFGVLKNRFRCLLCPQGLQYSPEKATQIINVCCALHNMCIKYNCHENKTEKVQADIDTNDIKEDNGEEENDVEDNDEEDNDEEDNNKKEAAMAIQRGIASNL